MIRSLPFLAAAMVLVAPFVLIAETKESDTLDLHTRSRQPDASANDKFKVIERTVAWDLNKTALIVIDMWDDHWCQGAVRRVAELAKPMNQLIATARDRGVLIVHCPSTCVDFYRDSPTACGQTWTILPVPTWWWSTSKDIGAHRSKAPT